MISPEQEGRIEKEIESVWQEITEVKDVACKTKKAVEQIKNNDLFHLALGVEDNRRNILTNRYIISIGLVLLGLLIAGIALVQ